MANEKEIEEQGQAEENGEEGDATPATLGHYPLAPPGSSELFEISTTVDPSYIISLIRKLLPQSMGLEHGSEVINCHDSAQGSHTQHFVPSLESVSPDKLLDSGVSKIVALEFLGDHDRCPLQYLTDEHMQEGNLYFGNQKIFPEGVEVDDGIYCNFREEERTESCNDGLENPGVSASNDPWEEYGCILWDIAANRANAELMVQNLLLEVLLANLSVSKSVRVKEICLGITGNLACHEVPRNLIASTKGLMETVLDQLFIDDSPCLSETCRLLTLGLQSSGAAIWAEALQHEDILSRILWIAGNTLNSRLLEKSLELLLAVSDSQQVAPSLLPTFMELGLVDLLVDLLACEISKLTYEKSSDRDVVIDLILQVTEALSVVDNYSRVLSSRKEFFQLVCAVMKFPDKDEVASSCVTGTVLIANLLTDKPNLTSEISQDFSFLQGLLDTLPFVSDDLEAHSALWSVLTRMLVQVQEVEISQSCLRQYVSVLGQKMDLILEDFDQVKDTNEDLKRSNSYSKAFNCKNTLLRQLISILDMWIASSGGVREKCLPGDDDIGRRARKLLQSCRNYIG